MKSIGCPAPRVQDVPEAFGREAECLLSAPLGNLPDCAPVFRDSDKVRFSYTVAVTERGEAYPKMASGSGFVYAAAILAQRDRDTVNGCQHDGCSHEHMERAR